MHCRVFIRHILPAVFLLSLFVNYAALNIPLSHAQDATGHGLKAQIIDDPIKKPDGKVMRFGVHVSAMGKLDPHFAAGSQDRAFADMVFNGLLRYQPGNAPRIEPDLAEDIPEFEMVDGKQIWTLKLRKGVLFHPGPDTDAYELTADDVVFSLKKAADKVYCAYAGEYADMVVEKVARYTIRIVLKKPVSPILFLPKLTNYAGGFIVSKKAIEKMGYEQFASHPVGTGPFVFKHYRSGETLILKAHDRYFRGRPILDGVVFHFMPDIKKREAAFAAGRLDVITGSGEKGWIEKMEKVPGTIIDTHGVGEMVTIYFNTRMKPLTDIRVRRAMAYALSRKAFLSTTSKQFVGNVYSPVPVQFLPGGLDREAIVRFGLEYAQDIQKARQLMTEAGYPDGFDIEVVSSEKRIYRTCYEVLRRQLGRIGINCHVKVVGHSKMHKLIRKNPKPIVIYVAWRPNADAFLSRFFHSDSIVVSGIKPDTNFSHYDKIDKLIEAARMEINPEKQVRLWTQAQIRIMNDMAALPIMFLKQCYVRRSNVAYGHELVSTMPLYPQFTEKTRITSVQ